MPALRIAVIPNVLEATQKSPQEKEALLDRTCQDIAALKIAHLEFGFASAFQCALWVSGPSEAIGALRAHLDQEHTSYEAYETSSFDSEDTQPEDYGNGNSH